MTPPRPRRVTVRLLWAVPVLVVAAVLVWGLAALGPRPIPVEEGGPAVERRGPALAAADSSPEPRTEGREAPEVRGRPPPVPAPARTPPEGGGRPEPSTPVEPVPAPSPPEVVLREGDFTPCDPERLAGALDPEEAAEVCEHFREVERELLMGAALDPEGALDPEEAAAARAELRAALGEERYAAALYATGQANQVRLGEGSGRPLPAGLEPGDVLHAVDGVRVFSLDDLERRLEEGAADWTVLRRGEVIEVEPVDGELELWPWTEASEPPPRDGP